MNLPEIRRKIIRPIFLPIGFSAIGLLVAFLFKNYLYPELDKLEISLISFIVTTASVLYFFPIIFKIPFGKTSVRDWLTKVGLYKPDNIFKFVLLGIILASITLFGMLSASHAIGGYKPNLSNITLGQAVFSLTPGIWEEILYRGVLMIVLLRLTKSLKKAAIIQVLLFGLAHIKGFDLISYVDAFSVMILAISFTFVTYKTKSLIPAIAFHYLHDTFLFFVQLPDDQYIGFSNNAIFYSFLFVAIILTILIAKRLSERFNIQGNYDFYSIGLGGIKENNIKNPKTNNKQREIKSNKRMLLINSFGFALILLMSIDEASKFMIIFYSLFILANILFFIFFKKISHKISFYISILTSIAAFVTAYDFYSHGSETVYIFWILIGFANLIIGMYKYFNKDTVTVIT